MKRFFDRAEQYLDRARPRTQAESVPCSDVLFMVGGVEREMEGDTGF